MSPPEQANFVSAKVVSHAMAFLDGRNAVEQLASNARFDLMEMMTLEDDPAARAILTASRFLVIAMTNCAASSDDGRRDRWASVMAAMCDMVRHESSELKRSGAQRS